MVPPGDTTRPTSERVREAVFGALDARGLLPGATVLDLYCGSGALGLEAASRGAASVILVDAARQAVEAARQNVGALGFPRVTVVLSSVLRYVARPAAAPTPVVRSSFRTGCLLRPSRTTLRRGGSVPRRRSPMGRHPRGRPATGCRERKPGGAARWSMP